MECIIEMPLLLVLLFSLVPLVVSQLTCIRDFYDAEEAILNGSLRVLPDISDAFYPTSEHRTDYVTVRYQYALNCSDGGSSNFSHLSNATFSYIWASSSVYLVVEPNSVKHFTLGIVDVYQGSLYINLQCLCPPPELGAAKAILNRLTAYLQCYAKLHTKPERDDDCKTTSFIERYNPHDPLYKKVDDVITSIKTVLWLSLIFMFFLQFKLLVPIYTTIYKHQKEAFCYVWAVFFTGVLIFVLVLAEDIDSNLLNLDSSSSNDYKEVITGVYVSWVFGLLAALWFPKHIRFPVPVLTELFDILQLINTGVFAVLTFIIQTLCIWLMFCLIQLLTVHVMFFLVAVLAKPVVVMVSAAYMLTFVALTISGTSVMLEVISLRRISPHRVVMSRNSYKRDMFNFITSLLLPIFIVAVLLVTYEFSDKLGSTFDITGVPAAIVGIVQAVVLFVLSVAIRKKKFRQIFDEVEDESRHKFLYDDDHNTLSEDYSSINDS